MMSGNRTDDYITPPEDQEAIINEIKAYVTQPVPILTNALATSAGITKAIDIDFYAKIKRLDEEHKNDLKKFLDGRVNERHYFSVNMAIKDMVPATFIGFAGVSVGAFFSWPLAVMYAVGSLGYQATDQVYHQYSVKIRGAEVQKILEELIKLDRTPHEPEAAPIGNLLDTQPRPRVDETPSLSTAFQTLFAPKPPVVAEKPELMVKIETHAALAPGKS
jgi:hypothetical protein